MSLVASVPAIAGALGAVAQSDPGPGAYASPNEWNYVLVGWALIVGLIAAYAVITLVKGRRLSKQLPPEERRWTA